MFVAYTYRPVKVTFYTRINVKMGGINVVPEPRSVSALNDPHNPTIVMGYVCSQSRIIYWAWS